LLAQVYQNHVTERHFATGNERLEPRLTTGQIVNAQPVFVARLQIADCCPNLMATISQAPREEKNSEEIAEFLGDDSLQSSGTDYTRCSMPPRESRLRRRKRKGSQNSKLRP